MTSSPAASTAPDRRAALKERHRRAIIDAASSLMESTGGIEFSVDDLAARADVSRRTVFNHFASLDDVVREVCADVLGALVERFVASAAVAPAPGNGPDGAPEGTSDEVMFDEIVHALRSTDLVTPMAYLTRTLGYDGETSPARAVLLQRSLEHVADRFTTALVERHPDAEPLDVDLMVNAMLSGVVVLHRHWYLRTGAADDDASRALWAELVERLVASVGDGYRARAARHS